MLTRNLVIGSVLLCSAMLFGCGGDTTSGVSSASPFVRGDTLLPVDSVRLQEDEARSIFIGRPLALAVSPAGALYLSDAVAKRVFVFAADGRPERVYGVDGTGPGSFAAPGAIGFGAADTVLMADWGRDLVHTYAGDSLLPVHSTRVVGAALRIEPDGDTLWLGIMNGREHTGLGRIVGAGGAAAYLGTLPALYHDNPGLITPFGFSTIALEDTSVLLAYALVPRLYRLDHEGRMLDSVDLPKRLRRTEVRDLAGAPTRFRSFEDWMNGVSTVAAVQRLADSTIVVIMSDLTIHDDVVGGTNFISVLDDHLRPLCSDIVLRYPPDVRPLVAFHGDTLYTLSQEVGSGMTASTFVRRYVVGREICGTREAPAA